MLCSLGAKRELSGRSLGALWELVAVALNIIATRVGDVKRTGRGVQQSSDVSD